MRRHRFLWLYDVLLLLVIAGAAWFRFSGMQWGEYSYLHPDERFLVWVTADISPVKSVGEYFDTANSSLNPHNRGHGFFVYGTLPIFLTRYTVDALYDTPGWEEIQDTGRMLSAMADLGVILLAYLIGRRLYDRRLGLLAAAFSAGVVLQIQQSHFYTVDTFINFFSTLAVYLAVLVATLPGRRPAGPEEHRGTQGLGALSVLFGVALGCAVASKLLAAPVAALLPLGMIILYLRRSGPRMDDSEDTRLALRMIGWLVAAALVSLVVFRLAQPYAFSGPNVWNVWPNEKWVQNIQEQRAQAGPDVDFPPSMQWARRPVTFSGQNLVMWGLGLPLGILAWLGFLIVGFILLRNVYLRGEVMEEDGEEPLAPLKPMLAWWLVWLWTGGYFVWQSLQSNPTMRYQLPIYPMLVIFAAYAIVGVFDRSRVGHPHGEQWYRLVGVGVAGIVLAMTWLYAYAFTGMYLRPMTRVAASRWIYENVPGPINLPIISKGQRNSQILPFSEEMRLMRNMPYNAIFLPRWSGTLDRVVLPRVSGQYHVTQPVTITVNLTSASQPGTLLATGMDSQVLNSDQPGEFVLFLSQPVSLTAGASYNINLNVDFPPAGSFTGEVTAYMTPPPGQTGGLYSQTIRPEERPEDSTAPLVLTFTAQGESSLAQIQLSPGRPGEALPPLGSLSLTVDGREELAEVQVSNLSLVQNALMPDSIYLLDTPLPLVQGETYRLVLNVLPGVGGIRLQGVGIATEGDWDDGLPVRIDNYDGYGGIYPNDMGFNMYWDDNEQKLERMLRILDQADYIAISSNRQWGTLPRIPERFPLTTAYYRLLLGCPEEQEVVTCYREARPGSYSGRLGFELDQVFVSPPCIGQLCINDQYAEEAFTVYDHPKVMIFRKTGEYDANKVRALLSAVDLNHIIRKPPLQYSGHPEDLMLPPGMWTQQRQGGTWRELFNPDDLINRSQPLAVMVWYFVVWFVGLLAYPLLRLALPGLSDRGYPLARTAGMLILGWLVWLGGSVGIAFSRGSVGAAILLMTLAATAGIYRQREALKADWQQNWRRYLVIEIAALSLFVGFLLVRLGNPDLWHPWKGGERPMDFSYFNAILKSSVFPPYDPWYAGGYLNYYYFGFVMMGALVKFLGITPAVAYNLLLPTACMLIGLGAYSAGWNLHAAYQTHASTRTRRNTTVSAYAPAIAALIFVTILGNLGTVRMLYQGFQRMAVEQDVLEEGNLVQRWAWGIQGFAKALNGDKMPYSTGDWYWLPSRAIPAPGDVEPITEFPYFTLLYGDPHAHLWALPLTLLALGGIIGLVLSRRRMTPWQMIAWLFVIGLTIGALRPTNTWDMPTYLVLAVVGVVYTVLANGPLRPYDMVGGWVQTWPEKLLRVLTAGLAAGLVVSASFLLFRPYAQWFALGYTKVRLWEGTTTPTYSYFIHWGVFLFLIVAWVIYETIDWMKSTPAGSLRKLAPWRPLIIAFIVGIPLSIIALMAMGAHIAWFVVTVGLWVTVLLLRPGQPDARRIVLFLIGSGLMLTLMVELIVLEGDIGRMNTVFKFYLQVWVLFGVCAAAALGWTLDSLDEWRPGWSAFWQVSMSLLVAGAALFTAMATLAKIDDRMAPEAPHTLDGMAYMPYATYTDEWGTMDLSQDYRAIQWLQTHVDGSPVIVEANLRNLYRWGSRMTIYTGLPGVVGWEWHQQQQRTAAIPAEWVSQRIAEIDEFYQTENLGTARDFLQKYGVRYIIVGQQERGHYPGPGLNKFDDANGALWREVFRDGDTVIYEVIQ